MSGVLLVGGATFYVAKQKVAAKRMAALEEYRAGKSKLRPALFFALYCALLTRLTRLSSTMCALQSFRYYFPPMTLST